jgi:hypothetical protein
MTTAQIAAIAASIILAGVGVLQAFLAAGAPLGHFAWGGRHRVLPIGFRIASAVAIPLYIGMIVLMLNRAGILSVSTNSGAIRVAAWLLVGYFTLGVVANLASRSRPERYVMTPIVLVLAILAAVIAASP